MTYISQQKIQLLDSLENQVYFSKLVAVLVGDKGIGKTFFLEQLLSRLNSNITIANIDASLSMSEDQLDKTISLQLGLSWQKTDTSLNNRINNDIDQKVLVIIDDAHLLSSHCLNYVLKLNQDQSDKAESNLFIILAGDNRLPNMLSRTDVFSVHQDMCVVFQIECIEQNEILHLIAHFSQASSDSIEGLYSTKKLINFWKLSKGNPAELNYHLFKELDEYSPIKLVDVKNNEPTSYFKSILYVLIAVVLLSVLIFQKEINSWLSNDAKNKTAVSNIQLKNKEESNHLQSKKLTSKVKNKITNKKTKMEIIESDTKISDNKNAKQKSSIARPFVLIPKKITNKKETPNNPKQQKKNINNVEIENVKADKNTLTFDETELLSRDSRHYVMQWTGVSQLDTALSFKKNHSLKEQMYIYKRVKNNKSLYLVVSGNYSSKLLAKSDKKAFKLRGISGKPWIKSLSAIKNEIKTTYNLN